MSEKYIVIINDIKDIKDIKDILYIYPIKLINEELIIKILKYKINKINDNFIYYNTLDKKTKVFKINELDLIIDNAYHDKKLNNDNILMIIYKNIIIDNSKEKENIEEFYNKSFKIELIINILNHYINNKLKKKGNLQINPSAVNVSGDMHVARNIGSVVLKKISRGVEIGRKR